MGLLHGRDGQMAPESLIPLLLLVALAVVAVFFSHPRRVRAVILFLLVVALVVALFWPSRRETVGPVRFHPELEDQWPDPPLPEEQPAKPITYYFHQPTG